MPYGAIGGKRVERRRAALVFDLDGDYLNGYTFFASMVRSRVEGPSEGASQC